MNGNWIRDPRLRHAGTEGGKEAIGVWADSLSVSKQAIFVK